ncbi:MAG: 7-cyano-7-deazaguanine synthase QueC [Planctomycetota bacterium]
MREAQDNAVVLLSGGLDSATVLAIARDDGFACHALSFDYGQRHAQELDAARRVAQTLGAAEHRVLTVDPQALAGSALTAGVNGQAAPEVPKHRDEAQLDQGIPSTYVPARNTLFLSYALAWAEALGARDIYLGVNAVDYSGYPDCRPEYLAAFQAMAALATRDGVEGRPVRIHAPLIELTKPQIIERGLALGVDYGQTHSCYDPTDQGPCGACDACLIRIRAFASFGLTDPAMAVAAKGTGAKETGP